MKWDYKLGLCECPHLLLALLSLIDNRAAGALCVRDATTELHLRFLPATNCVTKHEVPPSVTLSALIFFPLRRGLRDYKVKHRSGGGCETLYRLNCYEQTRDEMGVFTAVRFLLPAFRKSKEFCIELIIFGEVFVFFF